MCVRVIGRAFSTTAWHATRRNERLTLQNYCSKVKALLRQGHEELRRHSHPDKYILPWMPGGTLFMRNPPLPFDVRSRDCDGVGVPIYLNELLLPPCMHAST